MTAKNKYLSTPQKQNDIEKHPKQDFQVERLAFFSDAVFAIAITLLIIEFKVPHVTKESTFDSVWEQLLDLKYNLFALLLSFTLIANYWVRHHFLFKHIHNYNKQIVIANMFVLMPIIFFPFTTAFFAESVENKNVIILALRLFLLNHVLAGLTSYVFYLFSFVKYKEMSFEMTKLEKLKFNSDTLFSTIVFAIILLVSFITDNTQAVLWTMMICILSKKILETILKKCLIKQ